MISVDEAIKTVLEQTPRLDKERVGLEAALGRILAQDVHADMDLPPFNRAQMDGFAVRAADLNVVPARLRLVGESAAGRGWHDQLKVGEAVRIMTGAPVPVGADAVVPLEQTHEQVSEVEIFERVVPGQNITPQAAEARRGTRLLEAGTKITVNAVATLAAFGYATLDVGRAPRVAVMVTGSELVPVESCPERDQIRDANGPMLQCYATLAGGRVERLPLLGDDAKRIAQTLADVSNTYELLLISGGVSVGRYDLTKEALGSLGARFFFERVRLRPGKPTVFARLNDALVFGLPGNPVSAAVTFNLFARTALLAMQGARSPLLPETRAQLKTKVRGARKRASLVPARLQTDEEGRLIAQPLRWGGSSDLVSFAHAEALIFVPEDAELEANSVARILMLP
ncbi:MAG: molybdopterin molybdenumtransferase MoeA [Pyrinomonas sp.]|uniref:molybdopterin molybdotransferase MoeA n=1 Tax=Pyrinomonas sp. TaxID=2080306 RepID=UPI00332D9102